MIRIGPSVMVGCGSCEKGGIGKTLLDERDGEFFSPPAGWFLHMSEGLLPGHTTMTVYCSEPCARKGQPWASEWFENDICCWECGWETASPTLGRKGKREPAEEVLLVLVPGWFAFPAEGGELAPDRVLLLTYCSEACVRKVNAALEE